MPTPFEAALGLYQGRIKPTHWVPEQGDYVYCLGHDLPGQVFRISFGDDATSITQSVDVTGVQLVRLVLGTRGPTSIPDGCSWVVEGQIDGGLTGGFSTDLAARRTRKQRDLVLDVHDLTGSHDLTFVLRAAGSTIEDAELPAVYLDAIQILSSNPLRPALLNRDPEPGDTAVPEGQAIGFSLVDLEAVGVDSAFTVYVDGELAIDGGVLQSPWSGSGSQILTIADGFTVGLVPATPWASQSVHTVRVLAATSDGAQIDESWTWTAEDLTPPKVVSAFALSRSLVRVTFDEALDLTTAQVAANYTLSLVSGAPAVTPVVTSATVESSGVVLLEVDRWQTPGAVYAVTVANVQDTSTNVIAAPYDVAQFAGFELPRAPGRRFDLFEHWAGTPHYEDPTGDLRTYLAIWQEVVDHILYELDEYPTRVLDPDTAEEIYVDRMLRDLGNPFDVPLTLDDKRRLIRVLRPLLAIRGTEAGIESAVRTLLGLEITCVPVLNGGVGLGSAKAGVSFVLVSGALSKKLSYDIHSPVVLTEAQRALIRRIASKMKRGVCHLRRFVEPAPPAPPAVPPALSKGATLSVNFYLTGP